jgi:hypothetical protein
MNTHTKQIPVIITRLHKRKHVLIITRNIYADVVRCEMDSIHSFTLKKSVERAELKSPIGPTRFSFGGRTDGYQIRIYLKPVSWRKESYGYFLDVLSKNGSNSGPACLVSYTTRIR